MAKNDKSLEERFNVKLPYKQRLIMELGLFLFLIIFGTLFTAYQQHRFNLNASTLNCSATIPNTAQVNYNNGSSTILLASNQVNVSVTDPNCGATPTPMPTSTGGPTATPTPVATPTSTPRPPATPTPAPTATPVPAPTVSVTSPTNGQTVSRTVSVKVNASAGTTKVQLYVDGVLKGTSTTSPFTISWNTRRVSSGTHQVQVKAYNAAGASGSSATISVTKR